MDDQTPTQPPQSTPLQYEETPIIEPQPTPPPTPPSYEPPKKKGSIVGFLKGLVFFVVLFGIGFALSGYLRDFFTQRPETTAVHTPTTNQGTKTNNLESTDTGIVFTTPEATATPKQYSVLNGLTRKPVENISFTLPSSVLPLICDGSACGSQGTYLPGGTRFTVAARGAGQVLADFRGKIISDAGGKPFTVNQTTIAGKPATEFATEQTGSTIGGYAFSRMHGYMIEVTDSLSLEINHFSPSGITTDFAADEIVFNTIVQSLTFQGGDKGEMIPLPTAIITPTITSTIAPVQSMTPMPTIDTMSPIR